MKRRHGMDIDYLRRYAIMKQNELKAVHDAYLNASEYKEKGYEYVGDGVWLMPSKDDIKPISSKACDPETNFRLWDKFLFYAKTRVGQPKDQ